MYINSDAMNQMIFPQEYRETSPRIGGASRYSALVGAFVGVLSGLIMRARDHVSADFSSRLYCRAAQGGVAGKINSLMQYSTKGA